MPKNLLCKAKAKGCHVEFIPKKFWQKTCENPECKKEWKRISYEKWYARNKERRRKYQAEYRLL